MCRSTRRGHQPLIFLPAVGLMLVIGCGKPATDAPARDGEAPPAESAAAETSSSEPLTIGSKAPALEVEHWYGDPSRPPITTFEPGKVHVVEFWATWCGPCVSSMPHLAELQERYADQDVTLISISDEDKETVSAFLERPVRGAEPPEDGGEPPTYADLTSGYRLTSDPDRSSSEDYMAAAGQSGIPTAFLVGKDGVVEWIGHPMGMDEPLAAVVAGTWDREAFGEEFRREQEFELRMMREQRRFREARKSGDNEAVKAILAEWAASDDVQLKMMSERFRIENEMDRLRKPSESGDYAAVDAILAEWTAGDDEQLQAIAVNLKPRVAVARFMGEAVSDPASAAEKFPEVVAYFDGDAKSLNEFSWNLAQMAKADQLTDPTLLRMAADATEAALDADEPEGPLLDTIAHLYAELGELDTAIGFQERAVAAMQSPDDADLQASIEAYLAELKAMKADAEEATEEPAPEETADAAAETGPAERATEPTSTAPAEEAVESDVEAPAES